MVSDSLLGIFWAGHYAGNKWRQTKEPHPGYRDLEGREGSGDRVWQGHSPASGHQVSSLSMPPEAGLRPQMVCNPDTGAERVM